MGKLKAQCPCCGYYEGRESKRIINMLSELLETHDKVRKDAITSGNRSIETLERGYVLGLNLAIETLREFSD